MRFALIEDDLCEAEKGLNGSCPGCGKPVQAKCGTLRVWHWAHLGNRDCDTWSETETAWHRFWKDNFPRNWQEFFMLDTQTGEKHMADVRTDHGMVIEFQHSHLDPMERSAREKFYRNMVWVVDGTRLKNDLPRFRKAENTFEPTNQPGIFHVPDPENCFPAAWLNSAVPVIFDFNNLSASDLPLKNINYLYCLFPIRLTGRAVLVTFTFNSFVSSANNGKWFAWAGLFMTKLRKKLEQEQIQEMEFRLQLQLEEAQKRKSLKLRGGRRF